MSEPRDCGYILVAMAAVTLLELLARWLGWKAERAARRMATRVG